MEREKKMVTDNRKWKKCPERGFARSVRAVVIGREWTRCTGSDRTMNPIGERVLQSYPRLPGVSAGDTGTFRHGSFHKCHYKCYLSIPTPALYANFELVIVLSLLFERTRDDNRRRLKRAPHPLAVMRRFL